MKKLYSLLAAMALAVTAPAVANAYSITLNVDNASVISANLDGTPVALQDGPNTVEYEYSGSLYLTATDGYIIEQLFNNTAGYAQATNTQSTSIYLGEYTNGYEYTVTTFNLDASRTASVTINVDNPDAVRVMRSGTYTTVTLSEGANTVKYNPTTETNLLITPANYQQPLYKITNNGQVVESQYGQYDIRLSEGAVIDIVADFPDIDAHVSLVYVGDCEDMVTGVTVNNVPVENYNAGFTAKLGSTVTLAVNTSNYNFHNITVNDKEPVTYLYGSFSTTITEENVVITIAADPYESYEVKLDLNDPSMVQVFSGSRYSQNLSGLVPGENTLKFFSANPDLYIVPANGHYIKSVTVNGEAASPEYDKSYRIVTAENMTVVVEAASIERNDLLVVYIDDAHADQYSEVSTIYNSARNAYALTDGYNRIMFCAADNPFNFGAWGAPCHYLYLDDELLEPMYEGGDSFEFTVDYTDSVLKIFLLAEPTLYNVSFDIDSDITLTDAKHDLVVPFTAAGFEAFNGTEVSFGTSIEPDLAIVTLNNEVLEAADGIYTFNVAADSQVKVVAKGSGVSNINAADTTPTEIYNLQGISVGSDFNRLPAGIYIIGGVKTVKK